MKQDLQVSDYPDSKAEIPEILDLAEVYYDAAMNLIQSAKQKAPLSYAPARLCSIHSIELYLNAFLRCNGATASEIRGRMHGLADPKFVAVLKLRKKTAAHLLTITERREYLISRYAPEQVSQHTELSRLTATLFEVMTKTTLYVRPS